MIEITFKNKASAQRRRDTEINQLVMRVSLCLCVSVVNAYKKGLSMMIFVAQASRLQAQVALQCRPSNARVAYATRTFI